MPSDFQPPCQAVIFDLDGLILDTERLGKRAWEEAAAGIGLTLPDGYYARWIGQTLTGIRPDLRQWLASDQAVDDYLERTNQALERLLLSEPPGIRPGVFEMLDYCALRRWPHIVATSTIRSRAARKLHQAGLDGRFPLLTTGDEVTRGKPAPDIFLLAARRLGFPPAHCVVLEDSSNGVRGAAAAGCRVIMIPDLYQPTEEVRALCWRVCSSLAEAPKELETLAQSLPRTNSNDHRVISNAV